jgi:cytochrome c5
MRKTSNSVCVLLALGLAGCASSASTPAAEPAQPAQPAAAPAQAPAPAPAPEPEAASTLSFTSAQANRGRDVFRSSCTTCHYDTEFSDQQFKFSWRRRTAGDLYDYMSVAMPEDAPGSLAPQQYVDILAYFLRLNDFDTGSSELPADAEALKGLSLAPIAGR